MARDRLANLRQGQQGYSQTGGYSSYQNDYPARSTPSAPQAATSGSYNGYSASQSQSYGAQYGNSSQGGGTLPPGSSAVDMSGQSGQDDEAQFFGDVREIQSATRDLNDNISRIQELHARSLDTLANDAQHAQISQQLNQMTDDTRQLSNSLKGAIKRLESQVNKQDARDPNTNVKRTQLAAVKKRFIEAIQRYQGVEQESRKRQRAKIERQFRIVKPDASQQEVQAVVDSSSQGGQVFQQALLNSNRYGDARAAQREVQDRHAEILKIEQTMTELAQMFNDMSTMVDEQDDQIVNVEQTAGEAEKDMHQAEGQMQQAVKSARAARKKRWICFGVVLVILIVIAIVLAVHFSSSGGDDNNNDNNNNNN